MEYIRSIISVSFDLFKTKFNVLGYNISFFDIFIFNILIFVCCYIIKGFFGGNE